MLKKLFIINFFFLIFTLSYADEQKIVYLNIEEVIKIIRKEDEPKKVLQRKYKLSSIQVDSILEIRFRQLAKLEEEKIQAEQKELEGEKSELEKILKLENRKYAGITAPPEGLTLKKVIY